MLIRPRDAATDDREWRDALCRYGFGQLIVPGSGRDLPVVVPVHFVFDGVETVSLHLARDNGVWVAVAERPLATLSMVGGEAYIPSAWNAPPGEDEALGIATSYMAAVQVSGPVEIVDDEAGKRAILAATLARFEPEGGAGPPLAPDWPHVPKLPAIRGLRLHIAEVRAKFKFGGNKSAEHRREIARRLAERGGPHDADARRHLLERLEREEAAGRREESKDD